MTDYPTPLETLKAIAAENAKMPVVDHNGHAIEGDEE
jgi:hypothetical protein